MLYIKDILIVEVSASLTGLVCIKPDYPMSWPVFYILYIY